MLKRKLLPVASLIGMGFLPQAQAADQYQAADTYQAAGHYQDDRWYVAPFATYIETGGDRKAADGWGGGLGVGKILNEHFNAELRGFYQGFGGTNGPWDLAGGTADIQYYFFRDRFSPYAVIGAGAMNTCASANCGVGLIGEAGLGATYEVNEHFLIRSDVRYRYNNNLNAHVQPGTDEFHDMTVNLGFVIPFGDKPQYVAAKTEATDNCSNRDSDADGVNDCLDKCPGTVKGSKIDATGCPIELVVKGVKFKFDSAELTPAAMRILDDAAKALDTYPQNDVEVQGHASSEGTDEYNMRLSERRSQSVVEYLKSKGVPNKLIPKGYGETRPIADNSTEEGRSQNRRVELIWSEE
ncbi:MAG: OmpA family protein [Methylomonas sp.]